MQILKICDHFTIRKFEEEAVYREVSNANKQTSYTTRLIFNQHLTQSKASPLYFRRNCWLIEIRLTRLLPILRRELVDNRFESLLCFISKHTYLYAQRNLPRCKNSRRPLDVFLVIYIPGRPQGDRCSVCEHNVLSTYHVPWR